jgi:hypothetical protein
VGAINVLPEGPRLHMVNPALFLVTLALAVIQVFGCFKRIRN